MNKKSIQAFHRRLHRWYGAHGRKDLPWRHTADPYAIYVSEIMLQQTQVATVLERYYFPFLKRFPTLAKLAAARQDNVLAAWHGLGYYNRATNLHKAAQKIVSRDLALGIRHWGEEMSTLMPNAQSLIPNLLALPGIGRNTAHAIAAFAYRQPVAVMEANVRRVLSRIFALETPSEPELWDKAQLLLDKAEPFDYNQAMMDVGALVCRKRAPLCGQCPANSMCKGKTSPESYPALKSKKTPPVRRKSIVLLRNAEGKYYATPRKSRFLNGLYHFVEMDTPPPLKSKELGHIRQQYSHFTLEAAILLMEAEHGNKGKNWYTLAQLKKLPVSMAEKKILELL